MVLAERWRQHRRRLASLETVVRRTRATRTDARVYSRPLEVYSCSRRVYIIGLTTAFCQPAYVGTWAPGRQGRPGGRAPGRVGGGGGAWGGRAGGWDCTSVPRPELDDLYSSERVSNFGLRVEVCDMCAHAHVLDPSPCQGACTRVHSMLPRLPRAACTLRTRYSRPKRRMDPLFVSTFDASSSLLASACSLDVRSSLVLDRTHDVLARQPAHMGLTRRVMGGPARVLAGVTGTSPGQVAGYSAGVMTKRRQGLPGDER